MKSFSPRGAIRRRITSAHIIALVALFVALGGISWAAATAPKNSVAAKSIKKNAVTSAKIKNNAVTGRKIKSSSVLSSDVKNDALTGDDVNEASLGPVPVANTAADQFQVIKSGLSTASNSDENIARSQAAEVPLISYGAISIYGKCFTDSDDNSINFETIARTTADGASLTGDSVSDSIYDNPPLSANTLEFDRQVQSDGSGNNSVDEDYASAAAVLGPDGKGLMFDAAVFGRAGNPVGPPGFLPAGNSCFWSLSGSKVG